MKGHAETVPTLGNRELVHLWSGWTNIVDDVACRRRRAARITDDAYTFLHSSLVRAVDKQVNRCKSSRHSLVREMQCLVSPWISLDSLVDADPHVLTVLLRQCRQLEKRLHHRAYRRRWVFVMVPLAIAVVSGVLYAIVTEHWQAIEVSQMIRRWQHKAYQFERAVAQTSMMTKMAVLSVLVILTGAFLLKSMRQD